MLLRLQDRSFTPSPNLPLYGSTFCPSTRDTYPRYRDVCSSLIKPSFSALLSSCTTKDLRSYYLPLEECYRAYEEEKYEIANKYITVILECFRLDIDLIRFDTGIMDIPDSGISFSYFTEEEFSSVERLIEKDRQKSVLSEVNKKALLSMKEIKL